MTVKKILLVAVVAALGSIQPAIALEEGEGSRLGDLMFRISDIDSDGLISREEHTSAAVRRAERNFDRIDSDGDGYINPQESREAGRKLREFIENRTEQVQELPQDSGGEQP